MGPPYGPKDRGPLVLRAGGGTSGRAAVGRPPSPLAPGPRASSGQGRALCQTGYSVVCSRGVGPKGTKTGGWVPGGTNGSSSASDARGASFVVMGCSNGNFKSGFLKLSTLLLTNHKKEG